MSIRIRFAILILALTWCQTHAGSFSLNVDQSKLDNGLTLLIYQDSTAPTVSVQTFVNAGSRDEDKEGATGIAHVFEHMMFRGTEKFPDYSVATAPLGAETNAYTTSDYTCYYINAESRFLEKMLEVESDRIRNLIFTNETFRTELGPVKEERRRDVDDAPNGFLEVELYRLAYVSHTYHHPVIGWSEDLEKTMTYQDGKDFKDRFYVPNNCILVICGNVDIKQTKKWVDRYYSDWKRNEPYTAQIMAEPAQTAERTQGFAWKDNETPPLLMIAFHTPTARDNFETTATLNVINEILFSQSGRLTKLLKNTLSLVESIDGSNQIHKDPSLEIVDVRLKRGGALGTVKDSIYSAIEKLKNSKISTEELDRARNNLRAQMIYGLDRPSRVAGSIGFYHVMSSDYKGLLKLYDAYSTVTPEMVRSVANTYLDKDNRTVVTLVPKSGI